MNIKESMHFDTLIQVCNQYQIQTYTFDTITAKQIQSNT